MTKKSYIADTHINRKLSHGLQQWCKKFNPQTTSGLQKNEKLMLKAAKNMHL